MNAAATINPHVILDTVHREIVHHLDDLDLLSRRLRDGSDDPRARELAQRVEAFFSDTAREHHAMEEQTVFPALLARGKEPIVQAIRRLQQDHGWIEENWLTLQPQLMAIAKGYSNYDPAEFAHAAEVFGELLREHIELEESLIYPESKRVKAAEAAAAAR